MVDQKSFYVVLESDLIFNQRLSDKSKILYSIICLYANNEQGYCYLTYKQLIKLLNVKKRQFYYLLNSLKKEKYITIVKKNNRAYIMPTINKFVEVRKNKPIKEIFDYDWLNES